MSPDRLGAHIPWARLDDFLPLVLDLDLSPEIAFKGADLDSIDPATVKNLSVRFAKCGIRPTIHAPFLDLNPGAIDLLVRRITFQRLLQTWQIANQLNARLMVVHPGFDRWRFPGMERQWLENATGFFQELLSSSTDSDCRLAVENIYEASSSNLVQLVDTLASPRLGHCFDVGHWHLFAQEPMAAWLSAVSPRLFHLHLHDNRGKADEHLPVGDGRIDFKLLFSSIRPLSPQPSMTLEAHRPEDLSRSLRQVTAICSS